MTWAKLDDRFYSHHKVLQAWRLSRASIGLYTMALAYSCGHNRDGHISPEFVEQILPKNREREQAVNALIEANLWHPNGRGWVIHDYLEYNLSSDEVREKRQKEADRKAAARAAASAGGPA